MTVTVYDRTIYLAKSEDEYLFQPEERPVNACENTLRTGALNWIRCPTRKQN